MRIKTDVVIVGTGVAGMFSALKLPRDKKIVIITKEDMRSSDSFLAQGGICVLRDENDYDSYFEDTMKAGHYENDKKSVEIMIKTSPEVVKDLVSYGAQFERKPCLHQRRRPFHQPYYFPRGCNRKRDHQHPAPRSPEAFQCRTSGIHHPG